MREVAALLGLGDGIGNDALRGVEKQVLAVLDGALGHCNLGALGSAAADAVAVVESIGPVEASISGLEQAVVEIQERIAGSVVDEGLDLAAAVGFEIADGAAVERLDGHAFVAGGVADELAEVVVRVRSAVLVVFDEGNGTHLHHGQALPLGALDDIAAIVDAMGEGCETPALVLPLGIVKVDHVRRREPLGKFSQLVQERIFLRLAGWVVDDAVLQRAAALRAVLESVGVADAVAWNSLVLREAGLGFRQQDEDLSVGIDGGRPAEQVGLEVVHAASGVTDSVKISGQPVGRHVAELGVAALELRDECAADGIHRPLIDRVLDRSEVEIDPAGVTQEFDAVHGRDELRDVFFLNRLVGTMTRVVRGTGRFVTDGASELVQ